MNNIALPPVLEMHSSHTAHDMATGMHSVLSSIYDGNTVRQDYQMQLTLLEAQQKRRLLMLKLAHEKDVGPHAASVDNTVRQDNKMQLTLLEAQQQRRLLMLKLAHEKDVGPHAASVDNTVLQDNQMQLTLLEAQKNERLLMSTPAHEKDVSPHAVIVENAALRDYEMQLTLMEQLHKKLLMSRAAQNSAVNLGGHGTGPGGMAELAMATPVDAFSAAAMRVGLNSPDHEDKMQSSASPGWAHADPPSVEPPVYSTYDPPSVGPPIHALYDPPSVGPPTHSIYDPPSVEPPRYAPYDPPSVSSMAIDYNSPSPIDSFSVTSYLLPDTTAFTAHPTTYPVNPGYNHDLVSVGHRCGGCGYAAG